MKTIDELKTDYNSLIEKGLVPGDMSWIYNLIINRAGYIRCGFSNTLTFILNSPKYTSLVYNKFLNRIEYKGEEITYTDICILRRDLDIVLGMTGKYGISDVLNALKCSDLNRIYTPIISYEIEDVYSSEQYKIFNKLNNLLKCELENTSVEYIYWKKRDVKDFLEHNFFKSYIDYKLIEYWINNNFFVCGGYIGRDYYRFNAYEVR